MSQKQISPLGEYRIKNFKVTVEHSNERLADFPDEAVMSVTYNGRQWQPLSFTRDEAEKVVRALSDHFGFGVEEK